MSRSRVYAPRPLDQAGVDPLCRSLGDFADKPHWRIALSTGGALLGFGQQLALWMRRGKALGCDEATPLHASVAKALAAEGEEGAAPAGPKAPRPDR